MTTYTMLDAMLASTTEPLPIEKRMYQLEKMWEGLENLAKAPEPSLEDWMVVSDAINMMEALRDIGAVEDSTKMIDDAIAAMAKAGSRSLDGSHIRLDAPAIYLLRGLLEDYCDALENLPARTVISAHRYAEKRIIQILKGKKRAGDRTVK